MEWENIDSNHKRAKIKGGWLVKAYEDTGREHGFYIAMCFVPDQMHAWKL